MKRILLNNRKLSWIVSKTISVLLLLGLSFTGCLETTREIPITLTVSTSALNFQFSDEEQTLTIESNTIMWRIDCDASWVTITPSTGSKNGTVKVRVYENTGISYRTATLTVSGTGIFVQQNIYLYQEGNEINMVRVEGGTFTMGCTSEQGDVCFSNEIPSHSVTLSTFYIGKYEVTQGQWKEVMGINPSYYPNGDNYPAETVSWNDIVGTSGATTVINGITYYANGFIYKLNQITGKQYRLPTEAEWEFAARGGSSVYQEKYSGSHHVDNVAWYINNLPFELIGGAAYGIQPIGGKSPNQLSIYDMSGNVWEWCSDWYESYDNSSQTNPTGPSTGSYRVCRGGSWFDDAICASVTFRDCYWPGYYYNNLGFRLASSSN